MSDSFNRSDVDSKRRRLLAALGGSASVAVAGCSALLGDDDPDDTDDVDVDDADDIDDADDDDDDGVGVDDGDDDDDDDEEEEEYATYADKAQSAWETVEAHPAPADEDIRNAAYVRIEEAVRDDMILLPLFHGLTERLWFDWVDVPRTGALGGHHQQHTHTEVEDDTELNLTNATFDTLDPIVSTDTASATVINQMYETLTTYPDGVPQLENQLLEEFEVSDDGLDWTLKLKEGVEFHDGSELTADDLVYSWDRLVMSPNTTRPEFFLGLGGFLGLEHETDEDDGVGPWDVIPDSLGYEAVDEYTIEMTVAAPNPGVLDILTYNAFAAVREGLFDDHPFMDGEFDHGDNHASVADGTGPFEFDSFTIDEEARVVRFDNYHDQVPSLESIHWEVIEDSETRWTYAAVEQNADIFGVPDAHYAPETIESEPDDLGREVGRYGPAGDLEEEVNYLGFPSLSTFYFGFNARHVPRPVRQAVAYVTHNEELVDEIFEGRGTPAFSFTPPPLWPTGAEGYADWLDEWPYAPNETDIESAQQVLGEAGYTPDDPFELTLTIYEDPSFQEAAELTRDKLAGTGLDIEIEQAPFSTLLSRGGDGDLAMYSLGWIWSWEDVAYGHYGFEPKNTDTSRMPGEANGYYLDWQVELEDFA